MAFVRLAAALLAVLAIVPAATAQPSAPTGLHGFLLRADEPKRDSFSRTPAFAWNPVAGAVSYQFQISTSSTFRDSGLVYEDPQDSKSKLTSPVAAPRLTLPWITGSPHALYARVRAIFQEGTSEWSTPFGFDVAPPAAPKPLASAPGVLRWTPVPGADGYEVWFVDANKTEATFTNVLDEREIYTFHQSSDWIGTVRWRVRAARNIVDKPVNRIPTSFFGPWSPIYTSTNTAFQTGPITLESTISDVVGNGSSTAPAHRFMPAFTWTGNETEDGTSAELFRVYVFTDKQCLNRVFTSAVVGSPAYSPRPFGPLSLPTTDTGPARSSYLVDAASEPSGFTYDGDEVKTTESEAQATPTVSLPTEEGSQGPTMVTWDPSAKFGAPVDLWDTNWPDGGYYWTVIPVAAVSPGALRTTVVAPGAQSDASSIPVASTAGFSVGDVVTIGFAGKNLDASLTVTGTAGGQLSFATTLKFSHGSGEPVTRTGGNLQYRDLELAPDVCAAGRVARFGKNSEPSLTAAGDAFASGLSPTGRLSSAVRTGAFYGKPLVAWTPALGASVYAVQWSKTRYPFKPEPDPVTKSLGILTSATSAVLPLAPGTWYYRVRGYDYSLPSNGPSDPANSQAMSWSDPAKIVVTKPKFAIVADSKPAAKPKKKSRKR